MPINMKPVLFNRWKLFLSLVYVPQFYREPRMSLYKLIETARIRINELNIIKKSYHMDLVFIQTLI